MPDGFLANRCLIHVHLLAFWVSSILEVANCTVVTILAVQIHNEDFSGQKLALTRAFLDSLLILDFVFIMTTMLIMLVKYGTPLSSGEKSAISMRLLLEFNADLKEGPEMDEKRKREQALRRHKHLQTLADL